MPYYNGAYFGKVARVNLASFSQVQVLDLTATDADLKRFSGGFASGGYGYLVPYNNGYSGKVARFVTPQGPHLPPSLLIPTSPPKVRVFLLPHSTYLAFTTQYKDTHLTQMRPNIRFTRSLVTSHNQFLYAHPPFNP